MPANKPVYTKFKTLHSETFGEIDFYLDVDGHRPRIFLAFEKTPFTLLQICALLKEVQFVYSSSLISVRSIKTGVHLIAVTPNLGLLNADYSMSSLRIAVDSIAGILFCRVLSSSEHSLRSSLAAKACDDQRAVLLKALDDYCFCGATDDLLATLITECNTYKRLSSELTQSTAEQAQAAVKRKEKE